ncbi:MAG TPA: hypothetical protein VK177_20170 [Flavobacteriales bacterium]|nr:hypothetical protein [Flavobacteriales bacterium]
MVNAVKYVWLFVFFIGLALHSVAQPDHNVKRLNLYGKVKSVKELWYKAENNDGKIVKGIRQSTKYGHQDFTLSFNKKGEVLTKVVYSSNDALVLKTDFIHDGKGNLIEMTIYDNANNWLEKGNYTYDSLNRVIASLYQKNQGYYSHDKYVYNVKGDTSTEHCYRKDSSLSFMYKNFFDEKGNRLGYIWYDAQGAMLSRLLYTNNVKGKNTQSLLYNRNNELFSKIVYVYDEKQNNAEIYIYKPTASYHSSQPQNGDENIIYDGPSAPDFILEEKKRYVYKYDKKGNWVTRIEYKNDVPVFFVERAIAYF